MSDSLVISGNTYNNVSGFKATDTNNNTVTYIKATQEVTIPTDGAVTQTLDPDTIYHFTGNLTSLTVTAVSPSVGSYQFDFYSGSTAPTLSVPSAWVMPNNFLVEPSGQYRLVVEGGYCVSNRWADNHSPFTYLDSADGDFTINTSGFTVVSNGKVYSNVGTEIISVTLLGLSLKNQLNANATLKICDVKASSKALIGATYVETTIGAGSTGKVTQVIFNTWDTASAIYVKNTTGEALPAGTEIRGTFFLLRTL